MNKRLTSAAAILLCLASACAGLHAQASESLVDLARQGYTAEALAALEHGTDPDLPSADNSTALMYAAFRGDEALVHALLEAGADPNARNDYGSSPLGEATINDHTTIISLLLDAGADANRPNDEGETPLMVTARSGNVDAVQFLLERGVDINAREQWGGQTALMWATAQKQLPVMKMLIEHGADVNLQGYPRVWERPMTAETRPKDMNNGGFSALQYAARQGCVACIDILVEAGADLDATDPDRVTALGIALVNFHFDAAAALIEAGAEVNQWDIFGRTPLYNAIDMNTVPTSVGRADLPSTDKHSGYDIAVMLLERGANPNARLKLRPPFRNVPQDRGVDKMQGIGATPLILAAQIGDVASVKLLLEHGALVDLSNTYGVTPLLMAAGVNFSFVPTRGRYRTQEQTLEILQLLLDAGADINTLTVDPTLRPGGNDIPRPDRRSQMSPADRGPEVIEGKNALHGAARHGWLQVAQFLIDHGVKQQVVDDAGRTPLDYAKGLYPPAFNDSPAEPNQAMIELLTSACKATDNCTLESATL